MSCKLGWTAKGVVLTVSQVVSLSFFRFDTAAGRLWAFAMMGLARRPLSRLDGIGFWKLCGSGSGEGFDLRPNTGVYAILATWPDARTARAQVEGSALYRRYRARAAECWTVYMTTASVRGAWSGRTPFETGPTPAGGGPVAALTRATLRPRIMTRFWGRVPRISEVIGRDPDVIFKIGIGDVPYLRQVTFSIWPDAARMAAFARTGPHAEAIRAVRENDWFREELYARFALLGDSGTWGGRSPLAKEDT